MVARQMWNDIQRVKSMVNVEYKTSLQVFSNVVTPTGVVQALNILQQGSNDNDRDGDSVRFKSLTVRMNWNQNASALNTRLRWLIVIDKQPNGALATITDILTAASPRACRNTNNMKRFVVLSDEMTTMRVDTETAASHWNWYTTLDMKTTYDGNAGTIADITTNSLLFVCFSDEVTNSPQVVVDFQSRYIDN